MKVRMLSKLVLLVLIVSFGFGCTSQQGDVRHTNFLGIYERKTNAYETVPHATIPLRRANIDPGADYSGDRVSILWGLFTYYDY